MTVAPCTRKRDQETSATSPPARRRTSRCVDSTSKTGRGPAGRAVSDRPKCNYRSRKRPLGVFPQRILRRNFKTVTAEVIFGTFPLKLFY